MNEKSKALYFKNLKKFLFEKLTIDNITLSIEPIERFPVEPPTKPDYIDIDCKVDYGKNYYYISSNDATFRLDYDDYMEWWKKKGN